MNLIELVQAYKDGSARKADVDAVFEMLDRALRSNDNGCAKARRIMEFDAAARGSSGVSVAELVEAYRIAVALAEQHLVTVARLEAERDAALAARNDLERRNQELVEQSETAERRRQRATGCANTETISDVLARLYEYAECRPPLDGIPDGIERIKRERDDERRRQAETAASAQPKPTEVKRGQVWMWIPGTFRVVAMVSEIDKRDDGRSRACFDGVGVKWCEFVVAMLKSSEWHYLGMLDAALMPENA